MRWYHSRNSWGPVQMRWYHWGIPLALFGISQKKDLGSMNAHERYNEDVSIDKTSHAVNAIQIKHTFITRPLHENKVAL